MSRTDTTFATISSAGGLLPAALLARLADAPDELPGTGPTDYGLIDTKKVKSAINEAWNDLLGQWEKFRSHVPPPGDRDDDAHYLSDTRTMWLLPLMQTLGWGRLEQSIPDQQLELATTPSTGLVADGRHFPLTHETDRVVPVHLLGVGVPLDRRTKGVPGAADQSPHSMLQEILNVSDRHLWAITSNGEQLRILRDTTSLTRQAYVEFDLATMFDNQVFSDFAVLWLICHRTRFPQPDAPADCWLEQWQNLAAEQGVRALDDLRDGVAAAIEALASGLIEHPNNTGLRDQLRSGDVDDLDLYRQVLRTVYRMMFLLVVEDRNLLHTPRTRDELRDRYARHYSMDRLRGQARNHLGGRHGDGWQQWQTLTGRLGTPDGIPQLGVPSLVGGLFDPDATPLLHDTQMSNRQFYEAVRRLAFVQRESALHRIDFRNLGSEELGSVYEALLELQPTVDLTARTFRLGTVSGNERKTTGSYYTPTSLINVLLNEALDPVVDQAIADAETAGDAIEEAILSITVCDPAMGSAHFLVGAAFRLAKRLAQVRTTEAEPSPEQVQQALRDVVSRCLYGVDINPMAVELAKVSLWLECHVPGQPMTFLDHHLKHGNSLLGIGFDTSIIDYHRHGPNCGHNTSKPFDGGIPPDAFKPLAGDDKQAARAMRDASDSKGAGQFDLFSGEGQEFDFDGAAAAMANYALKIGVLDDSTPDALATKRKAHMLYGQKDELARLRLRADAWTATWTIPKTKDALASGQTDQPYHVYYDSHYDGMPGPDRHGVRVARSEAHRLGFFHWFAEFPDIAKRGGFDLVLGNPPWGRVQLDPIGWLTAHGIGVADAGEANRWLAEAKEHPSDTVESRLARSWESHVHRLEGERRFYTGSGRYPLGSHGKMNYAGLFLDMASSSISPHGRAGLIAPDKLATISTHKKLMGLGLLQAGRVATAYMFENESKIFPAVHNQFKFSIYVLVGASDSLSGIWSTPYLRDPAEVPSSRFELSLDFVAELSPSIRQLVVPDSAESVRLLTKIYSKAPAVKTSWKASGSFRYDITAARREGAVFPLAGEADALPLVEAKMIDVLDHRYGTYDGITAAQDRKGVLPHIGSGKKSDPSTEPTYRWGVKSAQHQERYDDTRGWSIGWRDAGRYDRALIPAAIPGTAVPSSLPLLLTGWRNCEPALLALMSALVCDYAARAKGTRMKWYVVGALPIPSARELAEATLAGNVALDFLWSRGFALSYTSHSLDSMAIEYGMTAEPIPWNETQRSLWFSEVDAFACHLYGLSRRDVSAMADAFSVLAKYDRKAEGIEDESDPRWTMWRTKRLILEKYDELAQHAAQGTTYVSPDEPPALPDKLRLHSDVSA